LRERPTSLEDFLNRRVVGIDHGYVPCPEAGELVDVRVARLLLGPAGRDEFVEEGADDLADVRREAPALLADLLAAAVRSVDLPMHLL
jgi:hypothetical protein